MKLKTKHKIVNTIMIVIAMWFAVSYMEVMCHNLSAMGEAYMSDWNLFKLFVK